MNRLPLLLLLLPLAPACIATAPVCEDDTSPTVGRLAQDIPVDRYALSRRETAIGNLGAGSVLRAGLAFGAEVGLVSSSQFASVDDCGPTGPLAAGRVDFASLRRIMPRDDTLRVLELNGTELRLVLESSVAALRTAGSTSDHFPHVDGLRITVDCSRAGATANTPGQRLSRIERRDGSPIGPDDPVMVATILDNEGTAPLSAYGSAVGEDGTLTLARAVGDTFSTEAEVRPLIDGRITLDPSCDDGGP